jgi:hypothetical protein
MMDPESKDQSLLDHKPGEGARPDQTLAKVWGGHTLDLRLTVPWLFGGFYMVFLAGKERRPKDRRKTESKEHKIFTSGNLMFLIMLAIWTGAAGYVIWKSAKSIMGFD